MQATEHGVSYTLALGPAADTWLGPDRLVLRVAAERVLDVEYRPGDESRALADQLPRFGLDQALRLAGQACERCSYAHSLAFCQAIEQLLGLELPPRAAMLRVTVVELERAAGHLTSLSALFGALGQDLAARHLKAVYGEVRAILALLCSSEQADMLLPGGLRRDMNLAAQSELKQRLSRLNRVLFRLADRAIDQRPLLARTLDVGTINTDAAGQYLLAGPLGRASGLAADLRVDAPYAAYAQLAPQVVVQQGGDVYARLVVLALEALEAVKLAEHSLSELPEGEWKGDLPPQPQPGVAESAVEAPSGVLRYRLESDGRRLAAVTITPPRQLDRLLARTLFSGALVDNLAPIMLSTAPCRGCGSV